VWCVLLSEFLIALCECFSVSVSFACVIVLCVIEGLIVVRLYVRLCEIFCVWFAFDVLVSVCVCGICVYKCVFCVCVCT